MNISDIQPIINKPALFIYSSKIIVFSDLHIGIESELRENGLNVPSQTNTIEKNLIHLCEKFKPKEIILLGDIKHNIPTSSFQERRDVQNILKLLQLYATVHVLPGNHDGNIGRIISDSVILHKSDGFLYDNIGFVHGHRWPSSNLMSCDQLIIGHTHPTIMLSDRLSYKSYESCWIFGKFIKSKLREKYPNSNNPRIIVMPAFNPLCGGIAVNKYGVTGPFGKLMNIKNSKIYLLDGSFLGKVNDI